MPKYDKYAASIMVYQHGSLVVDHRLYILKVVKGTDATLVFNAVLEKSKIDFYPESDGYYGWDIILTRIYDE